jgi:hypothetical protein
MERPAADLLLSVLPSLLFRAARSTRATFSTKGGKENPMGKIKVIVFAGDRHVCVWARVSRKGHIGACGFFSISFSFVRLTQGQCARRTAQGLANFTAFDAHTAVLPAGCGRVLALNVIFLVTRDELCWELHFIIMHLVRESN